MRIYNGIYDLSLYIQGIDILGKPGVMLKYLDVYESIIRCIPTCELEIVVPSFCIDNNMFVDGSKIDIKVICEDLNMSEEYHFRLYNVSNLQLHDSNLASIRIVGVIDFYDGYTHSNEFNRVSCTSDIFKEISNSYGFVKCDNCIDDTNDNQLWVANTKNLYQYMSYLCKHGWKNDTSAMIWCIDRQKRLLYKNIIDLFINKNKNIFGFYQSKYCNLDEKRFSYSHVSTSIQSGTNNIKNGGYGSNGDFFDLKSYEYKESHASLAVLTSESIGVNKELSNGLNQNWYSFDFGNNHEHFYDAINQNERLLSLFSVYTTLNVQYLQPYRLCQIVDLYHIANPMEDEELKLSSLSGTMIISAIKIHITNNEISSVVELSTQGLNTSNEEGVTY